MSLSEYYVTSLTNMRLSSLGNSNRELLTTHFTSAMLKNSLGSLLVVILQIALMPYGQFRLVIRVPVG